MKKLVFLFLFAFALHSAMGHEYILIADSFHVKKGELLELHLFVADGFNVELERPYQASLTREFELINELGTTDLKASSLDMQLPLLNIPVDFDGQAMVQLVRDYSRISLSTEEFKEYLVVDNIEGIEVDESKEIQKERYSRYIKTLIQSTPKANDQVYKTRLGHTFEIVLLDNPYEAEIGDWIRAQVSFKGLPLKNKVITARNRAGNQASIYQYSRTDNSGVCSFKMEREGDWFIHATHMIECPDPEDSDWESYWASYSFGIE